jgi:cobalt-zinc-cadmium efflux system protein
VAEVHDLHIWDVTSGMPALSAHVLVDPTGDCHQVRRDLETLLNSDYRIDHTTLQVDHADMFTAAGEIIAAEPDCAEPHGLRHYSRPSVPSTDHPLRHPH